MKKYLYFIVNLQLIDTPGVTLTDQSEIYDAVTMQWSSSVVLPFAGSHGAAAQIGQNKIILAGHVPDSRVLENTVSNLLGCLYCHISLNVYPLINRQIIYKLGV